MTEEIRVRIEELAETRLGLIERLKTSPTGLAWCREHSELIDQVILQTYRAVLADHPVMSTLAVVATGGYGRKEMSPYSDIDITVVPTDDKSIEMDRAIRAFFQELHTSVGTILKLGVGYAYRLIADAPGLDGKSRTGLMDARLVVGPHDIYQSLLDELSATLSPGEFILEKIREREAAFAKFHDTPLVVEPQLKEGAGGMRCFHCANWLRNAIGEQEARPTKSFERLVRARNLLHALAGKPQDQLTRSRQEQMAEISRQDSYEMMSDIAIAANEVHAEYLEAKDKLLEARFPLSKNVIALRGEARIAGDADAGESAVGVSIATALGLRVSDLPVLVGSHVSGPAAVYAISTGEATLRNLDRAGLLQHLIPELTACRTLMPRDNVHRFTVYEHTLQLVRWLDRAKETPWINEIRENIHDLEPLYLAALLHDIGKIDPDRSHSELGAEMSLDICRRWNVSSELRETVVWLVQEHLTMMRFVRLRDIYNPDSISEFAGIVKNRDRLDLLTILSWADVNAVAPEAWTAALETFTQELHRRTADLLEAANPIPFDAAQQRQRLMRQLREDVPPDDLQRFVESLPPYYLASTPPNLVKLHFQLVRKAENGEPTVETFSQPDLGATEFTVSARDEPGLLSRLLGVLYAFDLSVGGIRACTTESPTPVALDTFTVSFGSRPVPAATRASVSNAILEVLRGNRATETILLERGKDPARDQEIFTYSYSAGPPGVLEIRAPRGRGMPYRFSRLIARQGWNILAARVGQWADSGAATFYIVGEHGDIVAIDEIDRVLRPQL
ncbi:MAG: hypothetical protein BGO01_14180 [Armatimonadetes bacterium 55-13]|nr:HD domain-containing protein [Armatimonadota bacterium]OJU64869.1 MAG: hypothetical protein BGO01_14180 [Armatimonadetes bacterium 55-13]